MHSTKKIKSIYSGILEVSYYQGQKVLDSKNTSYSYGNLQKVWDKALNSVNFKTIDRILILGMGGGSTIKLLREKYFFLGKIVAIELDAVIIEIAKNEFGIKSNNDLKIHCIDAVDYVKKKTRKFDLILIDLFIDNKVPSKLFKIEFWNNIASKISKDGLIIFNAFLDIKKLNIVKDTLENKGLTVTYKPNVNGANMMMFINHSKKIK